MRVRARASKLKTMTSRYKSSKPIKVEDNIQTKRRENVFCSRISGVHETEVFEGNRTSREKFFKCKKNPGHLGFIPVKTFQMKHLREGYHDKVLYTFVKAAADLTVKVNVAMTSLNRPDVVPHKKVAYPCLPLKGTSILRTGSGRVWFVVKYIKGLDRNGGNYRNHQTLTCPCHRCRHSDTPSASWYEIFVVTATHVVFDEDEASHTYFTLDLFSLNDVRLEDVTIDIANIEDDRCQLRCVTCDMAVGDQLERGVMRFEGLWKKVFEKYKGSTHDDKLTFIVSYPHGHEKCVTFGRCLKKLNVGEDIYNYQFTYSTCTCAGSSGAAIHIVGTTVGWFSYHQLVHSGTIKPGNNYSGVGYSK